MGCARYSANPALNQRQPCPAGTTCMRSGAPRTGERTRPRAARGCGGSAPGRARARARRGAAGGSRTGARARSAAPPRAASPATRSRSAAVNGRSARYAASSASARASSMRPSAFTHQSFTRHGHVVEQRVDAGEVEVDHAADALVLEQHVVAEEVGVHRPRAAGRRGDARLEASSDSSSARRSASRKGSTSRRRPAPPARAARVLQRRRRSEPAGEMHAAEHARRPRAQCCAPGRLDRRARRAASPAPPACRSARRGCWPARSAIGAGQGMPWRARCAIRSR